MSVPPYILRKLRKKQRRLFRRLVFVLMIISGLLLSLWPRYFPETSTPSDSSMAESSGDASDQQSGIDKSFNRGAPSFEVLTPAGKPLKDLDGWTVTPPSSNGTSFFAYVDNISNVQLQISQQELPSSFIANTGEQMKTLATSFNADRTVITANKTTVYIGTSASGPQSVITAKNGLLILIKSSAELDEMQWSKYVDSLE